MKIRAELTFPGKLKDQPIICNLCKKFDIILSIVEASFSTDVGWAILVVEGSKDNLSAVFEYLKTSGVLVKDAKETP